MAYLKTILTYHMPSEAEVDKSLLESHGLMVNLLNANTTRNELGAPFFIQLQVPDAEADRAVALLKEFNPQRFGSVENVRKIEKELGNLVLQVGACMLVAGVVTYFVIPNPDGRLTGALMGGVMFGIIGYLVLSFFKKH